jgi:glycosyltransferase involved in cell wall biosynthesis
VRLRRDVARGAALARRIRDAKADVVVGDELCFREIAIAFPLLRRCGAKRVLLVHHLTAWETERSAQERRIARVVEKAAMRGSDRVIATSEATRTRLIAEGCGIAVDVVVPGSDRLAGASLNADPNGSPNVLFLGTIAARKRVLELVRAFATAAHDGARLTLVGSTSREVDYARKVVREVEHLGLRTRVTMLGEADDRGVARALAEADVLVMPSSLEGYGIAAAEAVHCGVPVIVARTPALEEAISPCPDAALCVENDLDLATALRRFTTDASLRTSMRAAARAASARMPTWATCIDRFRTALSRP